MEASTTAWMAGELTAAAAFVSAIAGLSQRRPEGQPATDGG